MDIMQTVNNLETAGFTRKQAEQQVIVMMDLKKDLMTKADGLALKQSMELQFAIIDKRFDAIDVRFEAMETRFEAIETKFEGIDGQFKGINGQIEGLRSEVRSLPSTIAIQQTTIMSIILGLMLGLIEFIKWYSKLSAT
jgi:hypothetical protein